MTTRKTAGASAKAAAKKAPAKRIRAGKPAIKGIGRLAAEHDAKKVKKEHKKKVVRDSFTMPQDEYQKIAEIKAVCLKAKMHVKKSEVLRAGLKMLAGLSAARLRQALGSLEKIKTGRPKKH